jgi:hypothetical protein
MREPQQQGSPQRARVALPPRPSVVRLGICGSAAASAVTPESPIWLPASRASRTAAPSLKSFSPPYIQRIAEAHGASCRPTTDARAPTTGNPATHTLGLTVETERREARHLRQRRRQRSNAQGSDLVACEPRKPHCNSDPLNTRRPTSDNAPARRSTRRELSPTHRCVSPNNREAKTRTRGRTAEIERREARHLRQRRRQRRNARVSDLVACEPRKPHCRSTTDARAPTTETRNALAWPYCKERVSRRLASAAAPPPAQ